MRLPLALAVLAASLSMGQGVAETSPTPPPAKPVGLQPAGEEVLAPDRIQSIMRQVADYQISHLNHGKDNDWVRGVLYTGVMATYTTTKDEKYLNEALRWANEEGNWTPRDYRNADAQCCGQTYLELYLLKRDPNMLAPIKAAIDRMMKSPKKGRVDWWWCDSLYMAPPVFARLSTATGDPKYIAFMNEMWWDTTDFLFDKSENLFFRDGGYFNKRTKTGKKVFWSRGNSWVMGGTVRVLQYLPADDPSRAKYVKLHQAMAARLVKLQGEDGLWRPSLLDAEEFPSPETSGTGLDCYAMAWGINNGTLERDTYLPVVQKAWRGLVGAVNKEGRLGYVQQIGAAPGSVRPDQTQEYGVGAFLLAGSEMVKLSDKKAADSPRSAADSPKPPAPPPAHPPVKSTWKPILSWPDPTRPLLEQFRKAAGDKPPPDFHPTGRDRKDYLKLLTGEVDFWKKHQAPSGAIIDPYKKEEWQYSTPAFAHAAAALVAWDKREDLLEPAAKAMDWATRRLSERKAATGHEDFYPPLLASALPLLKPRVKPERAARWEADLRRYDPYRTYRMAMGSMNWNIVALSGEALYEKLGLRDRDNPYVRDSLAAQGHQFGSPYGLYLEGPMAYDHFPRLWLAQILAQGYDGPYRAEIEEAMRRAAITSLFMESPWGELPAGGRSAHHQWNESIQCVTYEIYAARALKAGDEQLAGVYKRAAHLALASMFRWVRPSGEMQIVKNWVDPEQRHAYEGYSAHSQYNLWPASMMALAYQDAESTESVAERPAPADVGGYVLEIGHLHKVFANARGTYVEIELTGDPHYDATGLIRIHAKGVSPQLGPSDSVMAHPAYNAPQPTPQTSGVGVSWKDSQGTWRTLGELDGTHIKKWTVKPGDSSPERVLFDVIYEGSLFGAARIVEHYILTPGGVELTTEVEGYAGPLRYVWPVLADDGRTQSTITVNEGVVSVSQDGGKTAQTFTPRGAGSVSVEDKRYANHNGWARVAVAEYPRGGKITLAIAPKVADTASPSRDGKKP